MMADSQIRVIPIRTVPLREVARTVQPIALPVLECGTCGAPVRYATAVEAAWSRLMGGWPDPARDCLWCGPAGQRRAEWSRTP